MTGLSTIMTGLYCPEPECGAELCNFCGFNGACEDSGRTISEDLNEEMVAAIATRSTT